MEKLSENAVIKRAWIVRRYASEADFRDGVLRPSVIDAKGRELPGESRFEGNVLLNEGINSVLLPLLCGTSSPTAYDNTNARLGVGDSSTAAAATQTGLQAATNKSYQGMAAGYPTVGTQKATWQAEFGGSAANHAWQEFTVVNAADDTGDNFNRKVSDQGTKASGQTWTLTLEITFS